MQVTPSGGQAIYDNTSKNEKMASCGPCKLGTLCNEQCNAVHCNATFPFKFSVLLLHLFVCCVTNVHCVSYSKLS